MDDLAGLRADGRGDLGMGVAEDGAHLAGGEVEQAPPVGRRHEGALRALHQQATATPPASACAGPPASS